MRYHNLLGLIETQHIQRTRGVVVVVVVTFFNHNFVNCKATSILEVKNKRNKIQYKLNYVHTQQ